MRSIHLQNNSYVVANNNEVYNFGTGNFSLEAWVHSSTGGPVISRKSSAGGVGNGGFVWMINGDGSIDLAIDDGIGYASVTSNPTHVLDGTWHHVAVVCEQISATIYVDGEQVATDRKGDKLPPLDVNNSVRLCIGSTDQEQQPLRYFTGLMSEVRIWKGAREEKSIKAFLKTKLAGNEDGLVGYWPFDFDLALDFSPTRNPTQADGNVAYSTNCAPIFSYSEHRVTFLFSGAYTVHVKWGGSSGSWHDYSGLYLTDVGVVVHNNRIIENVAIQGNSVSWDWDGNTSAASFTFKLGSESRYFWPDGDTEENVLEGWIWDNKADGKIDLRGKISKQLKPCTFIQSTENGLVVDGGDGKPGTILKTMKMSPDTHQHFCLAKDGSILHMTSQLAMTVSNSKPSESTKIVLQPLVEGSKNQTWTFGADGQIATAMDQNLVLGLSGTDQGADIVLKPKDNPPPANHQFYSLSNRQFIYSDVGSDIVMDISGNNESSGAAVIIYPKKNTGTANQLWYFAGKCIISDLNGMVLTVQGGRAGKGVSVVMGTMRPGAPEQQWSMNGRQIISELGNFAIDLSGTTSRSTLVLENTDSSKQSQMWNLLGPDIDGEELDRTSREKRSTTTMVNYEITIFTFDGLAAGTDDRVEIALKGKNYQSTGMVTLNNSLTHSNPFERGQRDIFQVELLDVGILESIYFRYGENTWFGGERWILDSGIVYDQSRQTEYYFAGRYPGALFHEMPYNAELKLWGGKVRQGNDKLAISKYPATQHGGVYDHTYGYVETRDPEKVIYFDAAGGHSGSSTTKDILVTKCSLDEAVRMTTGHDIDSEHPLKDAYGTNDTAGKETCGIRASGKLRWDGQCHQICNRLMHVGIPRKSFDDVRNDSVRCPNWYGLSRMLFGPYGYRFDDWCIKHGFHPPSDQHNSVFDWIRMFVPDDRYSKKVFYDMTDLLDKIDELPEGGGPNSPAVNEFLQKIGKFLDKKTIKKLTSHDEL